jgi:hypothetical protein
LDFKDFSVQVIESEHGVLVRGGRRRRPKFEEITQPWSGPILGTSFVEGGSFLYLFTFGKHRVLHQSSGGFVEDNITGLKADIALLYPMQRNDIAVVLKALQPTTVFVHHFDEWRTPFSDGIPESNLRRAQHLAGRNLDRQSDRGNRSQVLRAPRARLAALHRNLTSAVSIAKPFGRTRW